MLTNGEHFRRSRGWIGLAAVLFLSGWGFLCDARGATPEELIAGIDARIDQVFEDTKGNPYTLVKVNPSLDVGRPYYARGYSWSVVGYAARCLYLNESLPAANARLQQNARYYLRELTAADETEILPAEAEKNTSTYSRIVDRDSLHWHAEIVLRLIVMYGSNGSVATGRIDAVTEAKCLEPIWEYVSRVSRLEKAEYLNSKTWHLWESENHHVQCFSIAWLFSKIAKDLPAYQGRTYANGATPAQLYAAWNAYFPEYVRERFRKGLFVEMMAGYNDASLRPYYNFYDFGDPEVKEHARKLLDLFWAYWAQEQFNDIRGGGRSRTTLQNSFRGGHGGLLSNMAYLYFMLGVKPVVQGYSINALLSSYRPPAVIADIATDISGRGTYEVRQTAQGLGLPAQTDWDQSKIMNPYRLNTDGGGIVRYTYCDPAFIMGTPMCQVRPKSDWVAISSQGRWQGVIFSGAAEEARISPCVLPSDEKYAFNAFWTVQSKGSMITQMLSTHQGASQMWAWISKSGLTDPVLEEGIFFVETDEANGAYAAIRPVGTTYTLIQDYAFSSFTTVGHWIVQLTDKYKPLILEVLAKDQVADFATFKALVKSHSPNLVGGLLTYTTIYGDVLTLDTSYSAKPTVNGVAVDYSPAKSYDSPFLHGDYNGETFVIEKGSRSNVYTMAAQEGITVVGSGSVIDGVIDAIAGGKTISLNAGATADLLVVGTSSEFGTGTIGGWSVTYDGHAMTWATGNGSQNNIFYLDLTQTTYTGGVATLALSWDYTAGGDLGIGWVSAQASAPVTLHNTGFSDGTNIVDLVTTTNGTFNFVNFNGNKTTGGTVDAPLTQIYGNASFRSNAGGAGYQAGTNAGTNTYSWMIADAGRRVDAAAFAFTPALDTKAPTIISLDPANGAVDILPGASLTATFDEPITLNSVGTLIVTDLTDGSSTVVISLPDARVSSPNGDDLQITLSSDLEFATDYSVQISSNAVQDHDATPNAFAGISGNTNWNFTVREQRLGFGPYDGMDGDTLHLWQFNEANDTPTSTAATKGGVALVKGSGTTLATLGNSGFTGYGNAGNTSAGENAEFLSSATYAVSTVVGAGGAFSFEAMINVSSINSGSQQIFSMDNSGASSTRPFQFRIGGDGTLGIINIPNLGQTISATIPLTGDDAFVANEWFHVAVTYNGLENTVGNTSFYWTRVDASRTQANLIGTGNMTADLAGSASVYGVGNDGRTVGTQNKNIEGLIDEVRVSGVARGADEFIFAQPPANAGTVIIIR